MRWGPMAAAVVVAGCATQPPASQQRAAERAARFDPESHRAYLATGNSAIEGEAFLRQENGRREEDDPTCAGGPVVAVPATAFFREVLGLASKGQMPLIGEAVGPENVFIVRQSRCDLLGRFSIGGLPPGDWLVATSVNWGVGASATRGGLLVYKVRLHKQETVHIVMTDRNLGIPR
jgi:hypothetical protein